jgi:hypothetical protein
MYYNEAARFLTRHSPGHPYHSWLHMLPTDARRGMEQMATTLANKVGVETTRDVDRDDADDDRPLKLVWAREDNRRDIGYQLKEVLE